MRSSRPSIRPDPTLSFIHLAQVSGGDISDATGRIDILEEGKPCGVYRSAGGVQHFPGLGRQG
jgi:hypothetical protein